MASPFTCGRCRPPTATTTSPRTWSPRRLSAGGWTGSGSPRRSEPATAPARPPPAGGGWAAGEQAPAGVGAARTGGGQFPPRRWIARVNDTGQLQQLSSHYPRVPHRIDGELLRYAARFGLLAHKDDQID